MEGGDVKQGSSSAFGHVCAEVQAVNRYPDRVSSAIMKNYSTNRETILGRQT